jgi:hypothetical protein
MKVAGGGSSMTIVVDLVADVCHVGLQVVLYPLGTGLLILHVDWLHHGE